MRNRVIHYSTTIAESLLFDTTCLINRIKLILTISSLRLSRNHVLGESSETV